MWFTQGKENFFDFGGFLSHDLGMLITDQGSS